MWDTEPMYSNSFQHQSWTSASYFRPEFVSKGSNSTVCFWFGVLYQGSIVISASVLKNTELSPGVLRLSTQPYYITLSRCELNFILKGVISIVFLLETCSSISLLWWQKHSPSFQPILILFHCIWSSTANPLLLNWFLSLALVCRQ